MSNKVYRLDPETYGIVETRGVEDIQVGHPPIPSARGLVYDPVVASTIWPGDEAAFRAGCNCDVEENLKRKTGGAWPKLRLDCPFHRTICQANPCAHGKHEEIHLRCEHCTNWIHTCVLCGAAWLGKDEPDEGSGWIFKSNEAENVKGWYCKRCR